MDTATRKSHHRGWARLFRARGIVEVWLGNVWVMISR